MSKPHGRPRQGLANEETIYISSDEGPSSHLSDAALPELDLSDVVPSKVDAGKHRRDGTGVAGPSKLKPSPEKERTPKRRKTLTSTRQSSQSTVRANRRDSSILSDDRLLGGEPFDLSRDSSEEFEPIRAPPRRKSLAGSHSPIKRASQSRSSQNQAAPSPAPFTSAHAPGSWENPMPLKIKFPRRITSPSGSTSEDPVEQHRIICAPRTKMRAIKISPTSSPDRGTAAIAHISPLSRLVSTKVAPASMVGNQVPSASIPSPPSNQRHKETSAPTSVSFGERRVEESIPPSKSLLHSNKMPKEEDRQTLPIPSDPDEAAPPGDLDVEMVAFEPEGFARPVSLADPIKDPSVTHKMEATVEGVRIGVGDVEINSGFEDQSSAPSDVKSLSPPARATPVFEGLSYITGGLTALEYLRAHRAQRLSLQAAASVTTISAAVSEPPSIESRDDKTPEEDKMTADEWQRIVEREGDSDIEALLDTDSETPPSSTISAFDYSAVRVNKADQPPAERRGKALRDFDCRMVDDWNSRESKLTRNPALHRSIFEAYIATSELESGEIRVINDVDADGAPPAMEFECSKEMLYHPEVPDPELSLGCGCEGPCDPVSKTCSCAKRQKLYTYSLQLEGFAYDGEGHLREVFPIWECGETCGCPPECNNRVIQRGRDSRTKIDIIKTKKKGWGVRARVAIPGGTFIGIYAGELIPEAESEARGVLLEEVGRNYLFDCDGYQIANPPPGLADVDPRLAQIAYESARRAAAAAAEDGTEEYIYSAFSVDAFHHGYTRYFNHSCDPNLIITQAYVKDFHPERPNLAIFTRRDIKAHEELCISYKGTPDEQDEPEPAKKKSPKGKGGRKGKSKTSASMSVPQNKAALAKQAMKTCMCGARNCDGIMFNYV